MADIIVVTRFQTQAGKEEELYRAARPFLAETRKESGCIAYDVYQNLGDKTFGIFHEIWQDWNAVDSHIHSRHFGSFMATANRILVNLNRQGDNPFEVNTARVFDPADPPTTAIVLVATRMKAAPGKADRVAADTQATIIGPSNSEEGCLGYDLYQNNTDSDLFMLYEQWKGFKAIQDHMATLHFGAFMTSAPKMLTPWKVGTQDFFEVLICTPFVPAQ